MKNILVTGVSKGVGLAIAEELLGNGYRVFGICRSNSNQLAKLKNKYQRNLNIYNYDLQNVNEVKNILLGKFVDFDTPLHGYVNNAAHAYDDLITNINLNMLESMFTTNVYSPLILTKYAIRNMLFHNISGSIVHISSISVHTGYKGLAMYASTKGALEAFSKNTAREWGGKGIRSNCIVAGFMETSMSAGLNQSQKDRIYKRTALKEPTSINSVANTVEYLVSERSRSITGQNIFVDSGTI